MRTEFLCISVLRVASGPRVKLASCKSALTPPPPPPPVVYSTDRSKAVVPVLVLLFVALWFILRGDLLLCQNLFKLSGLHGAWESAHYKVIEPGVSKNQTGSNT